VRRRRHGASIEIGVGMAERRRPPAEVQHKPAEAAVQDAVRIGLLGGFRASIGTRAVEEGAWPLRKAAALLKLLALARGHRLHRERVMDLLWPRLGVKAASNNLRQTLHVLRRTLDPDASPAARYLELQGDQLVLCPGGQLWVDVDAFEEAAATARRSRDPAAYRAAIELYAGELLPGDRYEEWTEGRREELRQLHLSLLVELARLHEEREEHEPAIEALRRVLSEEPAREEAHALLMRLYALSGQRQEAILQYERLRRSLARELDAEPGDESERLYEEIRTGSPLAAPTHPAGGPSEEPVDRARHNLPAPLTSFVGREREMLEARRLLPMTRLLTLAGAGGSGKTRLALEVARDLVGLYPDGVWLVELAPLTDPALVAQELAGVLELQERPGRPLVDTLADALGDREMLLVLDNCEHLIDASAHLTETLLHSCPRLRVLATSREALAIDGEVVWQVPPLSLPEADGAVSAEVLMRYEAVRLFVDRARLRLLDFEVTRENAGAVARVCRKLDGIPLAIELATARMGTLAVEQVAQRLDASLDVLSGASRTAEARQKTLRATLDWSHDLLTEAERSLFRKLSVFAGGWTLEAAETACSGAGIGREVRGATPSGRVSNSPVPNPPVLDLLGQLVDKSLVLAEAGTGSATRYRMLQPIRQYAREKLRESGEESEVKNLHAAFFLALAEEAEPELTGAHQKLWVERLDREHDNLRDALSWVLERGEAETGLRFGGSLWRFWFEKGYLSEGRRWMEKVLANGTSAASPVRVKTLEGMADLAQWQGHIEQAKATYEEMLTLSRVLGDKGSTATALNSLGTLAMLQGESVRAKELLEENMAVLRELEEARDADTTIKRYHVLALLGNLALHEEGDLARATTLWEESLALARAVEDVFRIRVILTCLAFAELLRGENERAMALCKETLALTREHGNAGVELVPEALVNLGLAELGKGDHERARASFEEALAMSQNLEITPSIFTTLEGMASLAGAREEDVRMAHLWGAVEAAREAAGIALSRVERTLHEPYLAAASSRLGEAAWEEALAEGRAMSLDRAAEYALSRGVADQETGPSASPVPEEPPAGEPAGELTRREREVAILVTGGLTNRQVAARLGISERTAANHVARILRKLGLHSRAQVATWTTENRLLAPHPD
jgi:predicted ATPase/DNA-binding SARP family transcriptional activator/DNA-binding CsgD family transcriptional regulator